MLYILKINKSVKNGGRGGTKAESKPEQIILFIIQMSNKHNEGKTKKDKPRGRQIPNLSNYEHSM